MTFAVATQCTVNGTTGSFLWQLPAHDLHFAFIGPHDQRKLGSPIFPSLVDLHDWAPGNAVIDWREMRAEPVSLG